MEQRFYGHPHAKHFKDIPFMIQGLRLTFADSPFVVIIATSD